MSTVYRVTNDYELPWPATDDHPNADIPRYQVAHTASEGEWPGSPTEAGIWYVSAHGAPTKQEVLDYLDPPAVRAERLRKIAIRADAGRSALMAAFLTEDVATLKARADEVTDPAAKALLSSLMLVVALDTRT